MTLYRDASIDEMRVAKFKWVVEAVPCVHGNYARHLLTVLENFERVYCDGVGEGTE